MSRFALLPAVFAARTLAKAQSFPCDVQPPSTASPADIRDVHPAYISVVMALGDSITAAFASRDVIYDPTKPAELPLEYRDISFSIGKGSDEFPTLPYYIRHYNASVTGSSNMQTLPQVPETGYLEPGVDFLNVALSSALSEHLPVQELTELKKQSARIPNFDERWKVMTILIGANDLCGGFESCNGNAADAQRVADTFEKNMDATLAALASGYRRTFVSIVSLFSIASVHRVVQGHHGILPCGTTGRLLDECSCIDKPISGSGDITDEQLASFDRTTALINDRIASLASKYNLIRDDFAVVAQSNYAGQEVPDFKFLSELDCFHPSAYAHGIMATFLWNSLFDADKTPRPINSTVTPFCPTPGTRLYVGSKAASTDSAIVV